MYIIYYIYIIYINLKAQIKFHINNIFITWLHLKQR